MNRFVAILRSAPRPPSSVVILPPPTDPQGDLGGNGGGIVVVPNVPTPPAAPVAGLTTYRSNYADGGPASLLDEKGKSPFETPGVLYGVRGVVTIVTKEGSRVLGLDCALYNHNGTLVEAADPTITLISGAGSADAYLDIYGHNLIVGVEPAAGQTWTAEGQFLITSVEATLDQAIAAAKGGYYGYYSGAPTT